MPISPVIGANATGPAGRATRPARRAAVRSWRDLGRRSGLQRGAEPRDLIDELGQALDALGEAWEVIVVDDGSTDGTFATLAQLNASAPAFASSGCVATREGRGARRGLRRGGGNLVVTIDGDGQDDPAEIAALLAKLDEGYDLVAGWKSTRRDPFARRFVSRIFNGVTGRVSGLRLHDMNCGLKAMRAEVWRTSGSTASCTGSCRCSRTTAASG